MIGDKDLDISDDANSSQSLRTMVSQIAESLATPNIFAAIPAESRTITGRSSIRE